MRPVVIERGRLHYSWANDLTFPSIRPISQASVATSDVHWEDLIIHEKIGQGGFGVVYKGEWKGRNVAVKKVYSEEMEDRELESFRMETEIMRYVTAPSQATPSRAVLLLLRVVDHLSVYLVWMRWFFLAHQARGYRAKQKPLASQYHGLLGGIAR